MRNSLSLLRAFDVDVKENFSAVFPGSIQALGLQDSDDEAEEAEKAVAEVCSLD